MSFWVNTFVRFIVDSWQSLVCLKKNIGRHIALTESGERGEEINNTGLKDGEIKIFLNKINLILIAKFIYILI